MAVYYVYANDLMYTDVIDFWKKIIYHDGTFGDYFAGETRGKAKAAALQAMRRAGYDVSWNDVRAVLARPITY